MRTDRLRAARQGGATIVELIIFIVIVSVGLAGILSMLNIAVWHSADPMIRKQVIASAEALLEEVTLQPFTYCDPDDTNVSWSNAADTLAGNCATTAEAVGAEAGETRYADPRFDNVNDYGGFAMAGIRDLGNNAVAGLGAYNASVSVANAGTAFNAVNGTAYANDAVLRIDVTVSRGTESVILTGYRFRHSPNAP